MLKKLYKISKDLYRINKLRTSLPLSNFLSRVHHAEQQRYKDLSRIGELRTSPSTDALSLCQERYHDKSHADTPMNPIRSRADMPANQPNDKPRADMHTNQPCDKTPCRSAYGTDPALAPYCHIPSTN